MATKTIDARRSPVRTPRQPLSREAILRAALDIIDQEGHNALSMRQLGRALGVEAMSLYHYFKNKDDLLDGAIEVVMQEIIETVNAGHSDGQDWKQTAKRFITAYRTIGCKHPNGFRLVTQRPLRTAAAKKVGQALADAFLASGLSFDDAMIAYRSMTAFVAGFVLLETSGMKPAYTMGDFDVEFERSLDILVAGIEICLHRAAREPRSKDKARRAKTTASPG